MSSSDKFGNNVEIQWCPGCPNHLILKALKDALNKMNLEPQEICLVSGIGQAAKLPHYLKCNFFNGLHGRALPIATSIALVNPNLKVFVTTGEGDCYGEGGNHFLHAVRRNPDITLLVHNNAIYALTKGQASPTTPLKEKRTLQLRGVTEPPLNPLATAIINGCSFVARGFALMPEHLTQLIIEATEHRGFSYIDIIQPCITWDPRPLSWFKERIEEIGKSHDPADKEAALELTRIDEKIPIGLFYKRNSLPVFGEDFYARSGFNSLVGERPADLKDVEKLLNSFLGGSG